MNQELVRLLFALLATALLIREARRAAPGSRRRLAFTLGASGFGLLAAGNLFASLGLGGPALLVGAVSLGIALLLGSLLALFLAYRAGEMNEQLRRAGDYVAEERAKRDRERRVSEAGAQRLGSASEKHGSLDDAKRLGERREEREATKGDKL
jgi:hypothetical protein